MTLIGSSRSTSEVRPRRRLAQALEGDLYPRRNLGDALRCRGDRSTTSFSRARASLISMRRKNPKDSTVVADAVCVRPWRWAPWSSSHATGWRCLWALHRLVFVQPPRPRHRGPLASSHGRGRGQALLRGGSRRLYRRGPVIEPSATTQRHGAGPVRRKFSVMSMRVAGPRSASRAAMIA